MSWPQWPMNAGAGNWPQSAVLSSTVPGGVGQVATTGTPYTPEQWAAMQQQNWQQWMQWQQQYQQWQQQYGKTMSALTASGTPASNFSGAPSMQPPLPPADSKAMPPPPEAKPPLPPDEPPKSIMPNFNIPPPVQNVSGANNNMGRSNFNISGTGPNVGGSGTNMSGVSHNLSGSNLNMGGANSGNNKMGGTTSIMGGLNSNMSVPPPSFQKTGFGDQNFRNYDPKTNFNKPPPNFNQAPPSQNYTQNWTPQKPGFQNEKPDNFENNKIIEQKKNQKRQIEELTEAEKNFDKQFEDWEAQFNKWKEQNAEHPDKQQYKEYEAKWENWRNQLLERREQMRKKKLNLMNQLGQTVPEKTPEKISDKVEETSKKSPVISNWDESKETADEESEKKEVDTILSLPPKEQRTNIRQRRLSKPEEIGSTFLKTNLTQGGIPGLDLVKEDEKMEDLTKDEQPPKEINETKVEETKPVDGPDFEAISKGINTILGDPKLISMLSNIKNNQPFTNTEQKQENNDFNKPPENTSRDSSNRHLDDNFNQASKGANYENRANFDNGPRALNFDNRQSIPNFDNNAPRGPNLNNEQRASNFIYRPPGSNFENRSGVTFDSNGQKTGSFDKRNSGPNFHNRPFNRFGSSNFENGARGSNLDSNRYGGSNFEANRIAGANFDSNRSGGSNFDINRPVGSNFDTSKPSESNRSRGPNFDCNRPGLSKFETDRSGGSNFDFNKPDQSNFDSNKPGGSNFDSNRTSGSNLENGPRGPNFDRSTSSNLDNNFGSNNSNFDHLGGTSFDPSKPPNFDRFAPNQLNFGNRNNFGSNLVENRGPSSNFGTNRFGGLHAPNSKQDKWNSKNCNSQYAEEEEEENIEDMDDPFPDPPDDSSHSNLPERGNDIYKGDFDRERPARDFSRNFDRRPLPNENVYRRNMNPLQDKPDTWDDALILNPAIIVDYGHKSLDKPADDQILEPVQTFDYGHISTKTEKSHKEWQPTSQQRRSDSSYERQDYKSRSRFDRSYDHEPRYSRFEDRKSPHERYSERSRSPLRRYEDKKRDTLKKEDKFKDRKPYYQHDNRFRERSRSPRRFEEKRRSKEKDVVEMELDDENKKCDEKGKVVLIEDILGVSGKSSRPARLVIIMRGPPGSGKTFLAKLIKDKQVELGGSAPRILSLDDYFMVESEEEVMEDGRKVMKKKMIYEYEERMENAYRQSLEKAFKKTITDGYFPFIILDCVNDKVKQFSEMWSFAKQNGFQVYICQMELDLSSCTRRNIHFRSEVEIEVLIKSWERTPSHYLQLDAASLLQAACISEVEMEDITDDNEDSKAQDEGQAYVSKWERMEHTGEKLARLDGTSKPLRPSRTMEDYLQLDEPEPIVELKPGQKRVRWADLEEKRHQKKIRDIGFVVGQTDWNRMLDPTQGGSALTQTKYIERVRRY